MRLLDPDLRYTNPGTSADLVLRVELVTPVDDEGMKANVIENQKLDIPWVKECPAHDGVAIICGAGPSLADTIEEIRQIKGDIFASNSANGYLIDRGVPVEYQVMLDPYPVRDGDCYAAKTHLLASIVDPRMFTLAKSPVLWHPSIEWMDALIKPDAPEFCYIGGGITVSNSAVCLAYTMGYRKFHIFGMDSSHREEKTHVEDVFELESFSVLITEGGKDYRTTYDMKQQVVVFLQLHKLLTAAGCDITVHGSGLLPDLFRRNDGAPSV